MSLHLDPGVIGSSINRNDLHLTSTGKGHDTTKGYYFPPSLYTVVLICICLIQNMCKA